MIQPAIQSGVINPEQQDEQGSPRQRMQPSGGGAPSPAMPGGGPLAGLDESISRVSGATQHLNPFQFARPIMDVAKQAANMATKPSEGPGETAGAEGGIGELADVAAV